MIDPKELNIIKDAILKTVPVRDHEVAIAGMNLALHVIGNLERITVALEKIADDYTAAIKAQE